MSIFARWKSILLNILVAVFCLLAILVFIGVPISVFVSPYIDLRTGLDYTLSISDY